jgi:hypothetical protein
MNEIVRWCRIDTPLGTVRIVARGDAIAGVWFDGQKYDVVPAPHGASRRATRCCATPRAS